MLSDDTKVPDDTKPGVLLYAVLHQLVSDDKLAKLHLTENSDVKDIKELCDQPATLVRLSDEEWRELYQAVKDHIKDRERTGEAIVLAPAAAVWEELVPAGVAGVADVAGAVVGAVVGVMAAWAPVASAVTCVPTDDTPLASVAEVMYGSCRKWVSGDLATQVQSNHELAPLHYGKVVVDLPSGYTGGKRLQEKCISSAVPFEEEAFVTKLEGLLDSNSDCKNVVLFIHGYNNTFKDAVMQTAQLSAAFEAGAGASKKRTPFQPLMFTWPSEFMGRKGIADLFPPNSSYDHAQDLMNGSLDYFDAFLQTVTEVIKVRPFPTVGRVLP